MYQFTDSIDPREHDAFVSAHPLCNLLQSSAWAEVKSNWDHQIVGMREGTALIASALVLIRRLPLGLCMMYVPRGPIMDYTDRQMTQRFFDALKRWAKKQRCIFIKMDPGILLRSYPFGSETPDADPAALRCIDNIKAAGAVHHGFPLLIKDSVRLAVSTRKLTQPEINTLNEKKLFPKEIKIATDGIALITNKQNTDSMLSLPNLTKILTGKITKWKELDPQSKLGDIQVVFDNANSSTVRYAIDSLCGGAPLYEGLSAQGNNPQVIDYVAKTPNALGVIGVSWIGNKGDSTNLSFSDRINVMRLSREDPAMVANSCKPFQAYLALGRYPLTRDVYILLTDPKSGLASGFTTFISSDRGQRIILKSGIVPATQSIRLVNVRENL